MVGYSGGPDSKALLYALIECGVRPDIVHVDHGWREESRSEAEILKKEAEGLGCRFFSTRLHIEKKEDAARQGRYSFFRSVYKEHQALLLAHHGDDLAETVLKRVFEGAHLENLGGMEEVSQQQGMVIWRPFLKLKKNELHQFLEDKGLSYFVDATNFDPTYLRSRMRGKILPWLEEAFGKKVTDNLILLSERSHELRRELNGKMGRLEERHRLLRMGRENGVTLTREVVETLLNWMEEGGKPRSLHLKRKKILVDGGIVSFISQNPKDSNSAL